MKDKWSKKKLGEVCVIERGGSPRPIDAFLTDTEDGVNWIKIGDATSGSKYITSTKEKIKPEGVRKSRMVYKGDFILSNSMSFGRPYILGIDGCIHDGWLVLRDIKNTFDKSFLYYYLSSPNLYREFKRLANGGVVSNLNSELVRGVNVIIPTLVEQKRIVAELDCLSEVIDKQKTQLRELDNLAQSIFYDLFGDPIANEKGWKKDKIGTFATCVAGATPSTSVKDYWENGEIPWLSSGEVSQGRITATEKCISQAGYDSCSTRMIPPHTVLMAMAGQGKTRGTVGVAEIALCTNQSICSILTNDTINVDYLYYQLKLLYNELRSISNGDGGRGGLNLKLIQGFKVILPPLALQQEFASKIEAIEKQKELIKQSLSETETLFNSRMDYYFN